MQEKLSKGESVLLESHKDRGFGKNGASGREYKDAYEAGDSEKMLEAQKNIARFSVEQREVENYRPVYDKPLQTPQNNVQQQMIPDERTRQWITENRWFETDAMMKVPP